MTELLLWPFVAGLVLTGIHAYFGLHVLARGRVRRSRAGAGRGARPYRRDPRGSPGQSEAGYWYALAFAMAARCCLHWCGLTKMLQQEAVIGIVYAVSASLGVFALDRAPQGAEHMKQLLIGSILTVTPQEVGEIALSTAR